MSRVICVVDGVQYSGDDIRHLRKQLMGAEKRVKELEADAERYQWGLGHPSLMANFFIKWKTKHDHYNHRNPGVHPSEAIDAAMETDE